MDFKNLLLSFDGRIGRQSWWIGVIIIIVVTAIVYFIGMIVLGASMMGSDPTSPEAMAAMMKTSKWAWASVILTLIFAYPISALMKKRLNDRNRPAWFMYAFWAPTVVSLILAVTGQSYSMTDVGGGVIMPARSTLSTVVDIIGLVVFIWAIIEQGFLRGTDGPNQYGPDPIAG